MGTKKKIYKGLIEAAERHHAYMPEYIADHYLSQSFLDAENKLFIFMDGRLYTADTALEILADRADSMYRAEFKSSLEQ